MVQSHAVLQVADGVLDLGVSAVVGFQFQGVALPVRDEGVIAVAGKQGQLGTGRGPDPADDEAHRCGVRLTPEWGVSGLGNGGDTLHPVGYGHPVLLLYGLYQLSESLVLADGDGEADIVAAADGDDVVGVEAAVGPHGERSGGTGVSHPAHRLTQEVCRAPGGVGPPCSQPGHQHVSRSGSNGQQRVIAPLPGVVVMARSLLAQSVGLADGGVQIDGQRPVSRTCPGGPGTRQQFPAHPVQLSHMSPPEAAQECPQGGWPFTVQSSTRAVPPQRSASASSMQSPPASADATKSVSCLPHAPDPGHPPSQGGCQPVAPDLVDGRG